VLYPIFWILALYIAHRKPNLKIGQVRTSRIGHMLGDCDLALTPLVFNNKKQKIKILLATEKHICNYYALQLIQEIKSQHFILEIKSNLFVREYYYFVRKFTKFRRQLFETRWLGSQTSNVINYPSIYVPTNQDRNEMKSWLYDKIGDRSNKPFVFLHNRDSAYLPSLSYHDYRNFSVDVFKPIIEKYRGQFNFFRGGKIANEPLGREFDDCLIDLPFSEPTDLVDILAQDRSEFYFGSDSGISSVSTVLRKPVATINHVSNCYEHIRRLNHLEFGFIPKKILNKRTGNLVGLVEMFENNWINFWDSNKFEESDLELIDNSSEDVADFFDEVLNFYKNNNKFEFILSGEQEEFWKIVTYYLPESFEEKLILDNCYISPSYLKKNMYLVSAR